MHDLQFGVIAVGLVPVTDAAFEIATIDITDCSVEAVDAVTTVSVHRHSWQI